MVPTVDSSFMYERRKRVARTGTALLPKRLVSFDECFATAMINTIMGHMHWGKETEAKSSKRP